MADKPTNRLRPAEVEMILRRAAELNARRWSRDANGTPSISPEILVQVAAAAGIPEQDVRRAMWDLASEKTAETHTVARKIYGPARLRAVREVEQPPQKTREHLESLLRLEQGLKLRRKTESSSLWDSGDRLGAVRRTLDFSGHRALLKTQSVELRVEGLDEDRCDANLTADVSNQRGEYLSLGGIIGVTLAVLFVLAGVQNPLFLLGAIPALAAPGFGFKFAYRRTCADIRRSLEDLLDAAEEGPSQEDEEPPDRGGRPPGQIRGLSPIPRFAPQQQREGE
jgi:hypothetical protein